MLIIFDGDDTLFQTTECLTPVLLERAVRSMVAEGLEVDDVEGAVREIQAINLKSPSSSETLKVFLSRHKGQSRHFDVGQRELNGSLDPLDPLESMHGALEVLSELSKQHFLALVTAGDEERQWAKLEKAGIEPSIFCKIIVCESGHKGAHYQQLAEEYEISSENVLVCGDRIHLDLEPAKALGFTTVQMRQGRGRFEPEEHEAVDYHIEKLAELMKFVKRKYDHE